MLAIEKYIEKKYLKTIDKNELKGL